MSALRESKPTGTASDGVDVAARYCVYKLFRVTDGRPEVWHALRELGENAETVARAVVRGWVVVRDQRKGLPTIGRLLTRDGAWRVGVFTELEEHRRR